MEELIKKLIKKVDLLSEEIAEIKKATVKIKKARNTNKKEDKVTNFDLTSNLLKDKSTPETNIDKVRLILYIYNKLKNSKIKDEVAFIEKISNLLKNIDYQDFIIGMWILNHNEFATNKKSWKQGWNINYLIRKGSIDKALDFKIDKIDTEISSQLRSEIEYLISLPIAFGTVVQEDSGITYF